MRKKQYIFICRFILWVYPITFLLAFIPGIFIETIRELMMPDGFYLTLLLILPWYFANTTGLTWLTRRFLKHQ